jgi:hypothetical protein
VLGIAAHLPAYFLKSSDSVLRKYSSAFSLRHASSRHCGLYWELRCGSFLRILALSSGRKVALHCDRPAAEFCHSLSQTIVILRPNPYHGGKRPELAMLTRLVDKRQRLSSRELLDELNRNAAFSGVRLFTSSCCFWMALWFAERIVSAAKCAECARQLHYLVTGDSGPGYLQRCLSWSDAPKS